MRFQYESHYLKYEPIILLGQIWDLKPFRILGLIFDRLSFYELHISDSRF